MNWNSFLINGYRGATFIVQKGLIFYWIHRGINLIIEEVYRGFILLDILLDTQGHKPYY